VGRIIRIENPLTRPTILILSTNELALTFYLTLAISSSPQILGLSFGHFDVFSWDVLEDQSLIARNIKKTQRSSNNIAGKVRAKCVPRYFCK
jgi:hypothetical protein